MKTAHRHYGNSHTGVELCLVTALKVQRDFSGNVLWAIEKSINPIDSNFHMVILQTVVCGISGGAIQNDPANS